METNELPELLKRVRQGDQAAFEVVYHRFNTAALTWARAIIRDPYQAEDAVQEAFIRMKDKLHQLQDDRKFTAWFRLMVRRVAMNHLRGNCFGGELAIHEVSETELSGDAGGDRKGSHCWQERKESDETVSHALGKLGQQAREILKASAFEDATSEELAIRFNMKKSNVYNTLSRAKVKANEDRFQTEVEAFVQERRIQGHPDTRLLKKPSYPGPYAFISVMIGEAIRFAGDSGFSYTELLGISGEAFRLNMPENCDWRGILTYDWSLSAYRSLERLGFGGVCAGRPQLRTATPELQTQMLSVILGSIDRGIPAIVRNIEINAMGFAYGYDNRSRKIKYMESNGKDHLFGYDQIGRSSEDRPVFVLGLRGRVSTPLSEYEGLRAIVDHANGKEPPLAGYAFGLDGYRLWLEAMEEKRLDLSGHAYLVAILAEARSQAAIFLKLLSEKNRDARQRELLVEAAECYRKVGESFRSMYPRFPFGYGGSSANRLPAIQEHLSVAHSAEKKGIALLETCLLKNDGK